MQIRRVLALCLALCVAASAFTLAQAPKKEEPKEKKRSKQEQADIDTLIKLVDSAMTGLPIGMELPTKVTVVTSKDSVVSVGTEGWVGDVPIKWESEHFIRGQEGQTYIPYTISLDPKRLSSNSISMFVRMIDKRKAAMPTGTGGDKAAKPPEFAFTQIYFLDVPADGRVSRAMMVPGGDYEVYIAIKDKNTGDKKQVAKMGLMRKDITVPNFNTGELSTSSILLVSNVEQLQTPVTNEEQDNQPYTFGTTKIVPNTAGKFKTTEELQLLFWIYGAGATANKKPDLQIEYNFHTKAPEGEKFFNKTKPQLVNGEGLPPDFDMTAGHPLPGSIILPLASFPAGDYRLEIKITDKPSGKTLTRDVTFSVVG